MPCFAAISFSLLRRATGPSFVPFTETGAPDSNPISTSSALSGAFSGDTTHCHIASFGALAGVSRSPPSGLGGQEFGSRAGIILFLVCDAEVGLWRGQGA